MPSNLYADVGDFQRTVVSNRALSVSDATQVERLIEAISREIDHYCGRRFYEETATKYFDGPPAGSKWADTLRVPDLLAITTIKLDEDTDATFELTLVAADYWLLRDGADDPYQATPKTLIRLNVYEGKRGLFLSRPRLVEIVGRWGYADEVLATGTTIATIQASGDTTLLVADGTKLAVGMTVKVESEQEYVEAVAANTATVRRAQNGTTAASHAVGVVVNRYLYPSEVRQAVIIQSSRVWKRRETGFAGDLIVNPVSGQMTMTRGLDSDVQLLLASVVRYD